MRKTIFAAFMLVAPCALVPIVGGVVAWEALSASQSRGVMD